MIFNLKMSEKTIYKIEVYGEGPNHCHGVKIEIGEKGNIYIYYMNTNNCRRTNNFILYTSIVDNIEIEPQYFSIINTSLLGFGGCGKCINTADIVSFLKDFKKIIQMNNTKIITMGDKLKDTKQILNDKDEYIKQLIKENLNLKKQRDTIIKQLTEEILNLKKQRDIVIKKIPSTIKYFSSNIDDIIKEEEENEKLLMQNVKNDLESKLKNFREKNFIYRDLVFE